MGLSGWWARRVWMTLAALNGFVSVAAGAFAAHGIDNGNAAELVRTAASYQFMHAMAACACATFMNVGALRARFAPGFFLSGIVLFSGSLYAIAAGGPTWLGAITPVGGVLFLIGWGVLAWAGTQADTREGL
jgi:uncharacterized membrane protein YgdD (TMEM256/DUF423 family)